MRINEIRSSIRGLVRKLMPLALPGLSFFLIVLPPALATSQPEPDALVHAGMEKIQTYQLLAALRRASQAYGSSENLFYELELTPEYLRASWQLWIEALGRYRAQGDSAGVVRSLLLLGVTHVQAGDSAAARAYLSQALGQASGQQRAYLLWQLALVNRQLGSYSVALEQLQRAEGLIEPGPERLDLYLTLSIALTHLAMEAPLQATPLLERLGDTDDLNQHLLSGLERQASLNSLLQRVAEDLHYSQAALIATQTLCHEMTLAMLREAACQSLPSALTQLERPALDFLAPTLPLEEFQRFYLGLLPRLALSPARSVLTGRLSDPALEQFYATIGQEYPGADRLQGLLEGIRQRRRGNARFALFNLHGALLAVNHFGTPQDQARVVSEIAQTYRALGSYSLASSLFESALHRYRKLGDRPSIGDSLVALGWVTQATGRYREALGFYQQGLAIDRETGDVAGEGISLHNLGRVYEDLGQYDRALAAYGQALPFHRQVENGLMEGLTLLHQARVYEKLGQYELSLTTYLEAEHTGREYWRRFPLGRLRNGLGLVYLRLGDSERAMEVLDWVAEGLFTEFSHQVDPREVAYSYVYLGLAQQQAGQTEAALASYQQAWHGLKTLGDRAGQGLVLQRLGLLYDDRESSETAVLFLKQAVAQYETIRLDLAPLPVEFQESYLATVETAYRRLIDLLLDQDRILEAQQVLELLKVQELEEYTRQEQRTAAATEPVVLLSQERQIIREFETLVAFGQRLRDCEASACGELSRLRDRRDEQFRQYRSAVASLGNIVAQRLQAGDETDLVLNPRGFAPQAQEIVDQQPGTVVIYPLVLEDRLWLLWAADGRVVSRREVPVTRTELGRAVIEFRALLEDPYSDLEQLKALGQQLYGWLVAPLAPELEANQIQHLVFAPDRTIRYLPLAALHDGEQYLVENYTVTNILSAALTDVSRRVPVGSQGTSVLGAGVSQGFENFAPLGYVPIELDTIIRDRNNPQDTVGFYAGQQLLDGDFTYRTLRDALGGQQFLHIATHGEFVASDRSASYLLMGDGQRLPIADIETLGSYLQDVHLVVLSACQTALGGPDEEGLEIAGLAYYFLNSQVDAVMASLWSVNDASTSQLMQGFYSSLAAGTETSPITKAAALRQAQLDLIEGNQIDPGSGERFTLVPDDPAIAELPNPRLSHPYYWAPFILIGNGL